MKKYCRIFILVLVSVAIFWLSACIASAESNEVSGVPTFTMTDMEEKLQKKGFNFSKAPSEDDAINAYCNEIKRRHGLEIETGSFLTDEETIFLENLGYNVLIPGKIVQEYDKKYGGIKTFEFPVIYEGTNGIELWYTNINGDLIVKTISGKFSDEFSLRKYGNIHYRNSENQSVLASTIYYSILYDTEKEVVSVWEYGNLRRTHLLPEDSIYAGFSENEGFIFRSGTDVYAVCDYGCFTQKYEVRLIARNVQFVIVTDYKGDGSEGLSQPLFLMTDGTIKCYCRWYLEYDVPADDDLNLVDVWFERGFNL